ncbi:paxillin-like [Tachypleus tridentatus]|uniref:paxillin-like n=1 Tax=Tachypleus tridentatus TaxID=6853 RepID=UPI003FD3BB6D
MSGKSECAACKKEIVGQVVKALEKTWHPEHFKCKKCNQQLATRKFFERGDDLYCEEDYLEMFAPHCAYCKGAIKEKCVKALDKTWHEEHFNCTHCGRKFGEDGFLEKDGKPYCRKDFAEIFSLKCGGCNKPINEKYISALKGQWHAQCFVCRDCGQTFEGGSFFDLDGKPYCEKHYHAKRGTLCGGCKKPISGQCVSAINQKYHPEHFVCHYCQKQLTTSNFKEKQEKPYCVECFQKLYG